MVLLRFSDLYTFLSFRDITNSNSLEQSFDIFRNKELWTNETIWYRNDQSISNCFQDVTHRFRMGWFRIALHITNCFVLFELWIMNEMPSIHEFNVWFIFVIIIHILCNCDLIILQWNTFYCVACEINK